MSTRTTNLLLTHDGCPSFPSETPSPAKRVAWCVAALLLALCVAAWAPQPSAPAQFRAVRAALPAALRTIGGQGRLHRRSWAASRAEASTPPLANAAAPVGTSFRENGGSPLAPLWAYLAASGAAVTFVVFMVSRMTPLGSADPDTARPGAVALSHAVVAGGTGFVGQHFVRYLVSRGVSVTVLTRSATKSRVLFGVRPVKIVEWDGTSTSPALLEALRGMDAVFSLVGEPIAGRWTETRKAVLRDSRLLPVQTLVRAIATLPEGTGPKVFISSSAIGYYGSFTRFGPQLTEDSPAGQDFLARLCVDWERAAGALEPKVRVVTPRLGIVFGREAGMLGSMIPVFLTGAGGPIGSGQQAVSWVHIDDAVRALVEVAANPAYRGAVNVTAPGPCTMGEVAKALARGLRRPYFGLPIPAQILQVGLGEAAFVLTEGQTVYPKRLVDNGFRFEHPEVGEAVEHAVQSLAAL